MSEFPFLYDDGTSGAVPYDQDYKDFAITPLFRIESSITIAPVTEEHYEEEDSEGRHVYHTVEHLSGERLYDGSSFVFDRLVHDFYDSFGVFAVPVRASAKVFFIHPDTGEPSTPIEINISCNHRFMSFDYDDDYGHHQFSLIGYLEIPGGLFIQNGKIIWRCTARDFSYYTLAGEDSAVTKLVMDIPEEVKNWYNYADIYHAFEHRFSSEFPVTSLHFQKFIHNYAVFSERFSNSLFLRQVPIKNLEAMQVIQFFEFPYLIDMHINSEAMVTATQNLHVICVRVFSPDTQSYKFLVLVFRTVLSPDIFDFYADTERSKSS